MDTPIVKRKKTLKKLASENQKLTSWFYKDHPQALVSKQKMNKEASLVEKMEEDAPAMVDTDTIIRKEQAKFKQVQWARRQEMKALVMEMVDVVVARSVVSKVIEDVLSRSAWIISIEEVWRLLQDDQPLQAAVRKKMDRNELEVSRAMEDIVKDDRLQKVADLRKRFHVQRAQKQMVDLGDLMDCMRITMGRESSSKEPLEKEPIEDMEWTVMEIREHEVLNSWWSE